MDDGFAVRLEKSLETDACDRNMQEVSDFVHCVLPEDVGQDIVFKIDLALEEVFVNICHYAYGDGCGRAFVKCALLDSAEKGRVFLLEFRDCGVPFNPLEHSDPDLSLPAEERDIGGLGIVLTKKFMDSIEYRHEDGFNVLRMTKTL